MSSTKKWLGNEERNADSVESPRVVDSGLFYEKRDDDERRANDRRANDRRDQFSWRSQIWKRTSLSQYCRRKSDRRDIERRIVVDRRITEALIEG